MAAETKTVNSGCELSDRFSSSHSNCLKSRFLALKSHSRCFVPHWKGQERLKTLSSVTETASCLSADVNTLTWSHILVGSDSFWLFLRWKLNGEWSNSAQQTCFETSPWRVAQHKNILCEVKCQNRSRSTSYIYVCIDLEDRQTHQTRSYLVNQNLEDYRKHADIFCSKHIRKQEMFRMPCR